MKSFKTGEVTKIVDDMEAAEAEQIKLEAVTSLVDLAGNLANASVDDMVERLGSLSASSLAKLTGVVELESKAANTTATTGDTSRTNTVASSGANPPPVVQPKNPSTQSTSAPERPLPSNPGDSRATLQSMKQSELKRKAEEVGITKKEIRTTLDEDNPKAALIDLIVSKQSAANQAKT